MSARPSATRPNLSAEPERVADRAGSRRDERLGAAVGMRTADRHDPGFAAPRQAAGMDRLDADGIARSTAVPRPARPIRARQVRAPARR